MRVRHPKQSLQTSSPSLRARFPSPVH
uniref:Uncharacterized protein n=1 Tax=Anopheles dirus TaxID=7168 RepID=A0A182NY02_9DIPT